MFPVVNTLKAWAAIPTTTSLAITSKNGPVTSITAGSAVTLTATVSTGTGPVAGGQVNFCDATAASCTDIHLLGTAQLFKTDPGAGTAFFTFHPGIGSHSYKAEFAGTPNGAQAYEGSTSNTVSLTISGKFPTKTSITGSGDVGNYSLSAT